MDEYDFTPEDIKNFAELDRSSARNKRLGYIYGGVVMDDKHQKWLSMTDQQKEDMALSRPPPREVGAYIDDEYRRTAGH